MSDPNDDLLRRIFLRAAELLERDGWQQGEMGPMGSGTRGPRCVLGACTAARCDLAVPSVTKGGPDWTVFLSHKLYDFDPSAAFIPQWNDAPGRTRDEVTALLRRAADAVG